MTDMIVAAAATVIRSDRINLLSLCISILCLTAFYLICECTLFMNAMIL